MTFFEIGTESMPLRVPPVLFPNRDTDWEAKIPRVVKSAPTRTAVANSLLAALPRKEYLHLTDELETVALTYGEVLYEPGERIKHAYFPNDSIVSLLTLVDRHNALEVGLVGREGNRRHDAALERRVPAGRARCHPGQEPGHGPYLVSERQEWRLGYACRHPAENGGQPPRSRYKAESAPECVGAGSRMRG